MTGVSSLVLTFIKAIRNDSTHKSRQWITIKRSKAHGASWHVQSGTSSQELMELGGWSRNGLRFTGA